MRVRVKFIFMISKIKTVIKVVKILKNWPLYFADYFKLVKRSVMVLKLENGICLGIRPRTMERGTFNAIWLNHIYTPPGFEIKDGDTIIDIGAHVGIFSIFAAMSGQDIKVYSFEPAPENIQIFERNISLNKIKNIQFFNAAVASESGEREFLLFSENASGHNFASLGEKGNSDSKIIIKTITLNDFLNEKSIAKINLLKINCEGAEYEILFNCPYEVFKKVEKISIQCHDMDKSKNINKMKLFLEEIGFDVFIKIRPHNMLYARR